MIIKEVKANINYLDCILNKNILKGEDLVSLYKEANIELSDERIAELEKGNVTSEGVPFINVVREKIPTNEDENKELDNEDENKELDNEDENKELDNEDENKELDNEDENKELKDKSNLETADLKKDNVETATVKPTRKNSKKEEK